MKTGIKIREDGKFRYIEGGYFPVRKYLDGKYKYVSQYLSWENATYMYAKKGQEEVDDYLLNHALQEEKKLCVSFYTKNVEQIMSIFGNDDKYDITVKQLNNPEHEGFSIVFVARKGCLADFYNMEYIEDIYMEEGFRTGMLAALEDKPLIHFLDGSCRCSEVVFDTYIDTENPEEDIVLKTFGPSALIITGLLYGYPIEITMAALKIIFPSGT